MMKMNLSMAAGLVCLCASASSGQVVWSNVLNYPGDLAATGDAWSAIRVEPPATPTSFRSAGDDFTLKATTKLTKLRFYSVQIEPANIIGGDWYIYELVGGLPGTLIAHKSSAANTFTGTGIMNPIFGEVFSNELDMDVTLDPGDYFLAFRTEQGIPPFGSNKPNNAALTTRVQVGQIMGHWNFDLFADGVYASDWMPMQVFTLTNEHEWAFDLEGEEVGSCYADCDNSGSLDFFDFLCFQNEFANGTAYADCDGSGTLDFFDFLCFQNAFALGCP